MMLEYNLRFFEEGSGGEKTEPATEKKLSDARKEGQVAKSREIANGLGLLSLFLVLRFWVGQMGIQFLEIFHANYGEMDSLVTFWNGGVPEHDVEIIFRRAFVQMLYIMAPIFLAGVAVSFLSEVAQVGWKPSGKLLRPKWNRISPASGIKKMISANSIVELIKSLAKIILIIWICYGYLKDKWPLLFALYDMPLLQAIQLAGQVMTDMGIRVSAVYMVLALTDYGYQRFKFARDMRMTKQEVKDEYKQQEGDPQIKGKIRQKMREVSQRRMMQNLPKADVVITNPTHYAVAIQYDPEVAEAPIVLAKGENYLALRIREVAKEANIEIVENKPLARMLYANVEIGEVVPPELYQAVAEILAFVYHLKGKE